MKIKIQNGFIKPVLVIIIIAFVGIVGYFLLQKNNISAIKPLEQEIVASESVVGDVNDSQKNSTQNVVEQEKNKIKDTAQIYSNTEFGFTFNYPTSWKMIKESDSAVAYRPPYLFDAIITTENHPINKAGHISVIALPLDVFMAEIKKPASTKVEELGDLKTTSFVGKKLKLVYLPVSGSTNQQIDYVYALALGDKTLYINFMSINTPEKQIFKELELQIDQMVKTVSQIK